jgi:hypothetical protein
VVLDLLAAHACALLIEGCGLPPTERTNRSGNTIVGIARGTSNKESADGCRDFFFLPSPFSQKNFSKKTLPRRVILRRKRERPMISYRLPVLGAIAVIVALIFNCGVAVSEPTTSADYVMPGCRDAASPITFSNVGESEEEVSRAYVCPRARLLSKPPVSSVTVHRRTAREDSRGLAGIVIGLSFMGQSYQIGRVH